MRSFWFVVAILAAGPAHADSIQLPVAATTGRIAGTVRDDATEELLAGATLVAVQVGGGRTEAAITDELGGYALELPPGTYDLTLYYGETTRETSGLVVTAGATVALVTRIDTTSMNRETGCVFSVPAAAFAAAPRFGLSISRAWAPVARDRLHRAWIAPLASADPERAVTTVDGARRMFGAPGLPLAFVGDVATYSLRTPIDQPIGSGGAAAVSLVAGSNEAHGVVRAIGDADRGGRGEAQAGGPIVKDKAWWAAGLVARRDPRGELDADALLRFDHYPSHDHQLSITGIGQSRADGLRDGWADLRWAIREFDHKLAIRAGLTAESLATGAGDATVIARSTLPGGDLHATRFAGRLATDVRGRAFGYHKATAGIEVGFGTVASPLAPTPARHTDAVAFVDDAWQMKSNIELEAGARFEGRSIGDARATVIAPRLALHWDPTNEGRADAFVAYQRVPHVDDGELGSWRGTPLAHDDVVAGAAYSGPVRDWIMVGAAMRARRIDGTARPTAGIEGWARIARDTLSLHASATSLDRIATVMARRTFGSRDSTLAVAVAGRASPEHHEGGASLAWSYTCDRRTFDVALEGFAGDAGPAARLALGARW